LHFSKSNPKPDPAKKGKMPEYLMQREFYGYLTTNSADFHAHPGFEEGNKGVF